jgi:WhiB family transcriptional regulator, redox-sensing transcriptional regulator
VTLNDVADEISWKAQGRCVGADPELFFPVRGGPVEPARAMCRMCPVREECLDYALRNSERFGIWGGKSERERRRIRRSMERQRRPQVARVAPQANPSRFGEPPTRSEYAAQWRAAHKDG